MQVRSFDQTMALMPNGMAKQILLTIMNTPPTDFAKMDKECDEYVRMRFAEMTPEERKSYEEAECY